MEILKKKKKKKTPQKPMTIFRLEGSKDAKRAAMVVLEVLAGLRKPTEAHDIIGVSLARYYAIEAKALQGFVKALENRGSRTGPRPETKIATLEREIAQLHRELNRSQALCRMGQRAIGLKAVDKKKPKGKRGRPKKGAEPKPKEPTRLEKQKNQSLLRHQ